ncbi:MAG: MmgE/PrpD family protein [Oscillospiraceae bacterium]|nr:MmgE/PrpD family protein [Oscillospiraceae bacterium]
MKEHPVMPGIQVKSEEFPAVIPNLDRIPLCKFDEDPAGKLVDFCVNTNYEDIPEDLRERAKQAFLDVIGVIIGGTGRPPAVATAEYAKRWQSEDGDGRVIVYGYKCPSPIAAVANGTFARCLDYGDCGIVGGHLSEHMVPTLLSATNINDKPISGKELIAAYNVGAEWGNRHHGAYNFHYHTTVMPADMGWVQSIVALAKLAGLNKEQFWNAVGLQFTATSLSTNQKNNEGTDGSRISHGFISSNGITSVLMARAGMTGVHSMYNGEAGVLRMVQWDDLYPEYLTNGLDENDGFIKWTWNEGNKLTIKPYAACKFTHSCIYCAARIRELYNPDLSKIKNIHCIVSTSAGPVTQPTRWNPVTDGDAMFSLPYAVCHSLMFGDVQLGDFTQDKIQDPEKRALMQKVTIEIDPNRPIFDGFTVVITMEDGTVYEYTDDGLPGSERNPMTWDQIENKFWKCVEFAAKPIPEEKLKKLIELCKHLEEVEDINEILDNMIA